MYAIDLNSDLGESFGAYKIGMDEQVIPLISCANIACGFHAGDPAVMSKTVEICKANGTHIGAHPGFPDLQGFGRRNMAVSPADVKAFVTYQIGALDAFCRSKGVKLEHVKPHGALYNMAAKDEKIAQAICSAVYEYNSNLILLALSGSQMIKKAAEIGLPWASEVFADRAYEDDGSLVARTKPGAMITDEDEAVERVIGMIKCGSVRTISGKEINIAAHSVCVHGDSEKALLFVQKLRAAFAQADIAVKPLSCVLKRGIDL